MWESTPQAVPKPKATSSFEGELFAHLDTPTLAGTSGPPQAKTSADCDYQLINTEEAFEDFLKQISKQKRFAFDTETDALGAVASNLVDEFRMEGWVRILHPGDGADGRSDPPEGIGPSKIKPILEVDDEKVGHNIKYDMLAMRQVGIEVKGVGLDSMVAAFLIDPGAINTASIRCRCSISTSGKSRRATSSAKANRNCR